jgi:hypothetical protein
MFKSFQVTLVLCAFLLPGCDDRPEEHRAGRERRFNKSARVVAQQIPISGETSLRLDIEYTGGYLELEREATGLLADVRLEFDDEENRPTIDYDSSSSFPTLRIHSPKKRDHEVSLRKFRDNNWRIKLSPEIPVDINIDGGAIDGWLDLTALKMADLHINVGAGDLRLEFREPNSEQPRITINSGAAETDAIGLCHANFRSLEFNGGVGKSRLSFDGEWKNESRVDLNFGVGASTVLLPRHVGAKVRESGSFLSPISMRGFYKRGDVHYSENYDEAAGHLDFDIKMGVGHTSIRWMD